MFSSLGCGEASPHSVHHHQRSHRLRSAAAGGRLGVLERGGCGGVRKPIFLAPAQHTLSALPARPAPKCTPIPLPEHSPHAPLGALPARPVPRTPSPQPSPSTRLPESALRQPRIQLHKRPAHTPCAPSPCAPLPARAVPGAPSPNGLAYTPLPALSPHTPRTLPVLPALHLSSTRALLILPARGAPGAPSSHAFTVYSPLRISSLPLPAPCSSSPHPARPPRAPCYPHVLPSQRLSHLPNRWHKSMVPESGTPSPAWTTHLRKVPARSISDLGLRSEPRSLALRCPLPAPFREG